MMVVLVLVAIGSIAPIAHAIPPLLGATARPIVALVAVTRVVLAHLPLDVVVVVGGGVVYAPIESHPNGPVPHEDRSKPLPHYR